MTRSADVIECKDCGGDVFRFNLDDNGLCQGCASMSSPVPPVTPVPPPIENLINCDPIGWWIMVVPISLAAIALYVIIRAIYLLVTA